MQTSTTDVANTVDEEPPLPKNVRIARRGVTAGLTSLVSLLVFAAYSHGAGGISADLAAFGRLMLGLCALAGLGVALYGYGLNRAERKTEAVRRDQEEREFAREQWELAQFETLQAADSALGKAVAAGVADLHAIRVEQAKQHEVQRLMIREMRELRTLVAEHDLRAAPRRKRRRRGRSHQSRPRVINNGEGGLSRLPSADVLRNARGLARRVIDSERRRAEDNFEDRS